MQSTTQILLTVAIVAAGIAAYQVIGAGEPPSDATDTPLRVDDSAFGALEERLSRLEEDRPARLHASGLANVGRRLEGIEARLSALESRAPAAPSSPATATQAPASPLPTDASYPDTVAAAPLTAAQEKRVRDLAARVLEGREKRRAAGFVAGALDRLHLDLTDAQKEKVAEAFFAHRQAVGEALDAARARGVGFEEARERLRPLEAAFRERLASVIPAAVAEELARTLTAPPGPPPGGPQPGGRPPRGSD